MKKYTIISAIILGLLAHTLQAQDKKLAQTGMKFLSVSTDARSAGFGEAMTAVDMASASAMFYNPSAMASIQQFTSASLGNVNWIADIKYQHGAIAFAPFDGDYGVIGISYLNVNYGEFISTIVANNDAGYLDVGTYSPKAYAISIGYAKALSTKFSVGGSIKFVKQTLGSSIIDIDKTTGAFVTEDNAKSAVAFDFGILYRTGFKSLNFGMSVKNFSTELKYKKETFQLPLTFRIGLSMDAMDLIGADKETHSLLIAVDAAHPRDYSEQVYVGAEYTFLNTFSLRAGYVSPNDEHNFSYGLGLKQNIEGVNLALDYAYQPFGVFNSVSRLTFTFSF
jgi:hypothetical protein